MKKLHILAAIALLTLATACYRGHHTIISTNNNGNQMKIEYSGNILLTNDDSAIQSISPGGYFKYTHNGAKLEAKRTSNGRIAYEVNGGDEQFELNNTDTYLLNEAITELKKHLHNGH